MTNIIKESNQFFIGGQWLDNIKGEVFDIFNPATGEKLGICAEADKNDVDAAVYAASEDFKTWKNLRPDERATILVKIADTIDVNAERLAKIETIDNGKPLRESLYVDLPLCSQHFRYFAGVVQTEEESLKKVDNDTMALITKEPIGVVAQIVPWNFPLLLAHGK